ncbi:hypothetical protein [Barrientosiimonas humi]|uniref:hypothetical protein n=1 Tax=Barrientosiimonas humi TaxID=999931 RepID=UPI00370D82EE
MGYVIAAVVTPAVLIAVLGYSVRRRRDLDRSRVDRRQPLTGGARGANNTSASTEFATKRGGSAMPP